MSPCKRCQDDPQPEHFGSPRRCAFESGIFSSNNWSCGTVNVLRHWAYEEGTAYRYNDTSIAIVPLYADDTWDLDGWIVMTYYKDRGKTSGAFIVATEGQDSILLSLEDAESAIANLEIE